MKISFVKGLVVLGSLLTCTAVFATSSGNGVELVPTNGGEVIIPIDFNSNLQSRGNTTEYVGGGEWNWGIDKLNDEVFSDYYHASLYHSSTATSKHGEDKDYNVAGKWSQASVKYSALGGNKVNWNTY